MKIIILATLVALVNLSSCKKKGCTKILAENYDAKAKKDDGSCTYPAPVIDERDKFIGSYSMNYLYTNVNSGHSNDPSTGTISITKSTTNENNILVNDSFTEDIFTATINGENFSIASQNPGNDPGNSNGNGSVSGNSISITINPYEGKLTGTGTKQ